MGCTAGGGRFVIILYIPGLGGRSHAQPRQIKVSAEKSNLGQWGGGVFFYNLYMKITLKM